MESRASESAASEQQVGEAPVVKLTAKAVEVVRRTLKQEKLEGQKLQVGLRTGGCAGFQYDLDVVAQAKPGDVELVQDGIPIVVEGKSVAFLAGTEIDYVDDGLRAGFLFQNPNARTSCGCGSSFQA